jgi:hypothetical protein
MTIRKRQQVVKRHFEKITIARDFQKDQLVMLWNKAKEKPFFHTFFNLYGLDHNKLKMSLVSIIIC